MRLRPLLLEPSLLLKKTLLTRFGGGPLGQLRAALRCGHPAPDLIELR
jgi:hypothetical protein